MPTYDYQCGACGHRFELFQPITAGAVRKCPRCGRRTLKRLIGAGAGIIFKGSGFYQTDYRSDAYNKAAEKDKTTDKDTSKEKDKPAPKDTGEQADTSKKNKKGK